MRLEVRVRVAIASTRAPLRPYVANSSVATARMSALDRSASLAKTSPLVFAGAFFLRLAIRGSSISDATVHHPWRMENRSGGRMQRRQVRARRQVPESRLGRQANCRVPGPVTVVFVTLHDLEEEAF